MGLHMANRKLDVLENGLGFSQPRSILRLSDNTGEFWTSTAMEYAKNFISFDKETLQHMENLKHSFHPAEFFDPEMSSKDLLLLWFELERCHGDDSLIMFLILAFKMRVLNPSRGLSRAQLQDLVLECAFLATSQVLHPEEVIANYDTAAYRPAGVTLVVKNKDIPRVTFSHCAFCHVRRRLRSSALPKAVTHWYRYTKVLL